MKIYLLPFLFLLCTFQGGCSNADKGIKIEGQNEKYPLYTTVPQQHQDELKQAFNFEHFNKSKVLEFRKSLLPLAQHNDAMAAFMLAQCYDLFPMETLKVKKELIEKAADERWLLAFEHDTDSRMGYVTLKDGRPAFEKVL